MVVTVWNTSTRPSSISSSKMPFTRSTCCTLSGGGGGGGGARRINSATCPVSITESWPSTRSVVRLSIHESDMKAMVSITATVAEVIQTGFHSDRT